MLRRRWWMAAFGTSCVACACSTAPSGDGAPGGGLEAGTRDGAAHDAAAEGAPCNYRGSCPSGLFCDAPDCAHGTCARPPAEEGPKALVCGCDGVTYWNASVAHHAGASVANEGACAKPLPCNVRLNPCSVDRCVVAIPDAATCGALDGVCWQMPASCPAEPKTMFACGDLQGTCRGECEAIGLHADFYAEPACPR